MENVTSTKVSQMRTFFILIGILIITTTLIVFAMPNTEKPRLSYTTGEPWTNPQLISPGDILINKDEKTVEQEQQDALRNEYLPYFTYDEIEGDQQTALFLEKYGAGIQGITPYNMQQVATIMKSIYTKGIMAQAEYSQLLSEDSLYAFMRVDAKQATRMFVKDIYSTKSAYEALLADPQVEKFSELLRHCNINEYLQPNITFDMRRSEQAKQDIIAMIPTNSGIIKQGQEIINRGDIVTEEKANMIDSYNDFIQAHSNDETYEIYITKGVQWLYVMTLMMLFMMYMQFFRHDYLEKPRSLAMTITLLTVFPLISLLIQYFDPRNVYIVPLCLAPMFIRVFLDSRTAYMLHVVMVLICAASISDKFEFIVVQLTAGVIAICALRELSKRSQMFTAAFFITITSIIALTLVKYLINRDVTLEALKHPYIALTVNGMLLLLTYPLMFLVEKAFGFISPVTLFELSDTNRDLLRRMSEVAPGTFQHSIMVSNLAAAIAREVGAKSLLVRTGALYHDIGKMANPVFFTENQAGVNPHDRMKPQESAQLIIGHVAEGVRMAEKHGVPDVIRNFILTHHGRSLARYFYNTYCNEHPDEEVDEKPFRYPGPNPFSREQAILMMADTVEAASRSLTEYTEETISTLVNRIIDAQVAEGYFHDCPITFRDIATAKHVLIERLKNIYHTRIQYPELKK
ncbi:MAG: HDIG domain-containing protein [Prevotella sp.]|nr:HDIG domain-containing protein [Candidatus Prevotella equi]